MTDNQKLRAKRRFFSSPTNTSVIATLPVKPPGLPLEKIAEESITDTIFLKPNAVRSILKQAYELDIGITYTPGGKTFRWITNTNGTLVDIMSYRMVSNAFDKLVDSLRSGKFPKVLAI